jgi:hypothetical protein
MEAVGVHGSIELVGNKIIIKRTKGLMSRLSYGIKGNKEILIKTITSIQFKSAGILNGYIQFSFSGGKDNTGGILDAAGDENTVFFTKKQQPAFEKLKSIIEEKIEALNNNNNSQAQQAFLVNVADEIKKLAELKDSGILTEEEFTAKKKQLLGI